MQFLQNAIVSQDQGVIDAIVAHDKRCLESLLPEGIDPLNLAIKKNKQRSLEVLLSKKTNI